MDAPPNDDRADIPEPTPRPGILRPIVKAYTGDLFTRVAALFGTAQRVVPPAP